MNLINWREASRILTGGSEGVRSNNIPKKHRSAISELIDYCKSWEVRHDQKSNKEKD